MLNNVLVLAVGIFRRAVQMAPCQQASQNGSTRRAVLIDNVL